jgi:hypothetical protein
LPPTPTLPAPGSTIPGARIWSFSYAPGIASYEIRHTATINNLTDSLARQEIVTSLAHEVLTVERVGDTIQLTIAVDSFAISSQPVLGATPSAVLPAHLVGTLTSEGVQLASDTLAGKCDPVASAMRSDLHSLVTSFPPQMSEGMTWTDSVKAEGCQGMIPTIADISRVYRVTGETIFNGTPAIVIERRDSIRAHGEGAQQQHRLIIDAGGNGTALEYLGISDGRVIAITGSQELNITIAMSGQTHRFRQSLKQEIAIQR